MFKKKISSSSFHQILFDLENSNSISVFILNAFFIHNPTKYSSYFEIIKFNNVEDSFRNLKKKSSFFFSTYFPLFIAVGYSASRGRGQSMCRYVNWLWNCGCNGASPGSSEGSCSTDFRISNLQAADSLCANVKEL